MKIVFFTPGMQIGGIERVFINYANILVTMDFEVSYLTLYDSGTFMSLLSPQINFINLHTNDLKKSIPSIAKFLRKNKPEYIVTANSATIIVLLSKIISHSKVKIIASHHNYLNNEVTSIIDRYLIFRIYNYTYKVVAVSEGIAEHLADNGVKRKKIATIYNPLNLSEIDIESSGSPLPYQYILYVGRISLVKNLTFLIDSYLEIKHEIPDIKLVLVGDGPEQNKLKEYVSEHNCASEVVFLGGKSNPYEYIKNAEVVVLPSFSEAFPTILLEALYLGKTIVSTPTKGGLEILKKGEMGYISRSFDNANEFGSLINRAIKHPINTEKLRRLFNIYYDPKKIIKKFVSILE